MSGLKLVGEDVTAEPNYPSCLVSSIGQAAAFSQKIGFLTHAVFAMGVHKGEPNVLKGAYKGLMTTEELEAATRIVLKQHGAAHVKSDMRTHESHATAGRQARRQRPGAPGRAHCGRSGFDVVERREGLPCGACGMPTRRVRLEIVGCTGCGFREERVPATGQAPASPAECDLCNP